MRIAIFCLVLAGCSRPEERSACDSLSEAFVKLSARCDTFQPPLRTVEEAAEHLFGAADACERVQANAFRDVHVLTTECIPGLERVECVAEPVLPAACQNQILVTF